jgi:hypothetical protein
MWQSFVLSFDAVEVNASDAIDASDAMCETEKKGERTEAEKERDYKVVCTELLLPSRSGMDG